MIRAGLKERSSIPRKLFTEQERVFSRDKLSQPSPSLQQWSVAEIDAVKMKKVEGAEDQTLRVPPER